MTSNATASPEERVNTYTNNNQSFSKLTALADGGWVVTWSSFGQDGDNDGVYQQRYDSKGDAVAAENRVNAVTADYQNDSDVAALADGGWVVTWTSWNQDGSGLGIYLQRYDRSGELVSVEIPVNSTTFEHQSRSRVTALADGGWVVVWESVAQDGDGSGVYQQRFLSDGDPAGPETLVNTNTTNHQLRSAVTALADGGWVVTWDDAILDGAGYAIIQQRYDANGGAVGTETRVNTTTTAHQYGSSVTALADGGWLVTWTDSGQDGSLDGIYQQRYDRNGDATGGETRVNTVTNASQSYSSVTALADGGWVVTWNSYLQDGDKFGIYQQRYGSGGNPVGTETLVNVTTQDSQFETRVTALADGSWVVTWSSSYQDGSDDGIYQRHFAPDILGGTGKDVLDGTDWGETLISYAGNDTLNGGGGDDILIGGLGNDTYVVDSAGDQIQEFATQGTDTVLASVSFTLSMTVENVTLTGTAHLNATGNRLANTLIGNAGKNTMQGGSGADTIYGGKGVDMLAGDAGADTFAFRSGDTRARITAADTIQDFSHSAGDRIDLHLIDANGGASGNGVFTFIGNAAFHRTAGELRVQTIGGDTLVTGDVNGDSKVDFALRLDWLVALQASDFML